jgi:predicted transcriptional regulator
MATNQVTSARLPEDVRARCDELARLTGRSRNELLVEALEQYLEREFNEIARIQEGLDQIDAGDVTPIDEVARRFSEQGMLDLDALNRDREGRAEA